MNNTRGDLPSTALEGMNDYCYTARAMAELTEIVGYLDNELQIESFADSSLNGLQVEGCQAVSKIVVSVDAGLGVIRSAVDRNAQMLIVHHGIFWGKPLPVIGPHRESLQLLLNHQLSLLAYHLPLDAHATWGNNFCLARLLKLTNLQAAFVYRGSNIGCVGEVDASTGPSNSVRDLVEQLSCLEGASEAPLVLDFGTKNPQRVGILSGAGADALLECPNLGIDTLITGEPRQFAYHFARDNRLNVIFAGHYASETLGVQAIGMALQSKFQTAWEFINHPTGI